MYVLLFLGCLLLVGLGWERVAVVLDKRRYPPPGQMIDVGGRRLHVHCTGPAPDPSVVILPGRFNTSLFWTRVHSGTAPFARVCVYDRAGYAWSDPDLEARSGARVADELSTLLARAEVPGPYLLVGHSLGAMYARLFAQRYPDDVAGMILVDPYTEGEVRGQLARLKATQARYGRVLRVLSAFGLPRLIAPLMKGGVSELRFFPPADRAPIVAFAVSAQLWTTVDREWQELDGLVDQLGGPGSLGETPLVVLRAGRNDWTPGGGFSQADIDRHWRLMKDSQAALTHLSTHSWLKDVPDTGHGMHVENPQAVIDTIREMLPTLR